MDKLILSAYRKNKKELASIDKTLERLNEQLDEVPVVCGKVTKSSDDFPYIEEHVTVQMDAPEVTDRIKKRILEKEIRKSSLSKDIEAVDDFIDSMPDGIDKEIFEMLYLDGMTQQEAGENIGLERSTVSKRVNRCLKLSHNSHF